MSAFSISSSFLVTSASIALIAFDFASSMSRLILSATSASVETALILPTASSTCLVTSLTELLLPTADKPSDCALLTSAFKRVLASDMIEALSISLILS